eukprot:PhM_4_TR9736/c0_g1_i1/m.49936
MEPEAAEDYSKMEYWDRRYTQEPEYDWFQTVYSQCLRSCVDLATKKIREASTTTTTTAASRAAVVVKILHLGTGNSKLVRDLYFALQEEIKKKEDEDAVVVQQLHVAVDYSSVVIDNMRSANKDILPESDVKWVVGDVRSLPSNPSISDVSQTYDLIIDKGTMDALQADKENDRLEEDLDDMLTGVSALLASPGGCFVQFTWEIPYYRFHYTKKEKYGWCSNNNDDNNNSHFVSPTAKRVEGSDMYYCFVYVKN